MGYYTDYQLVIKESTTLKELEAKRDTQLQEIEKSNISAEVKARLIAITQKDWEEAIRKVTLPGVIMELGHNPFAERCKWYDHEKDMKNVSSKFKNILFVLTGDGEDVDDIWRKYFYSGKMQIAYARITYDEFDEAKLR